MNKKSGILIDLIILYVHYRLQRANRFTLIRKIIRRTYFKVKLKNGSSPDKIWLDRYWQLLTSFNGACHYIDTKEAVTSLSSNFDRSSRTIFHTRLNPSSDLGILYHVWEKEEYKPVIERMLEHIEKQAKVNIIDAGANVGYATMYFKNIYSNANIVCLEPDFSNFQILEKNIISNGFKNIKLMQAGLWKSKAYLEVGRDFRDKSECSFYVKESVAPSNLLGYSVEEIRAQERWEVIDLLKVDIEGAERYLFESPELAQAVLKKVRFIAMEIHDEFKIRPTIYAYLEQNSFEISEYGELTFGRNKNLT